MGNIVLENTLGGQNMDKATFNKMPINEQVTFINQELSKGKSLRDIQKEKNIPKSTIQSRFKNNGYALVENEYIKETIEGQQEDKEEPKQITLLEETNSDGETLSKEEIKVLRALIKKEQEGNDKSISIDLPSNENTKTTIRVNTEIWNEFVSFSKDSIFKQQDLLSQAIKDFLAKHK